LTDFARSAVSLPKSVNESVNRACESVNRTCQKCELAFPYARKV
jgi:hypothetical protein